MLADSIEHVISYWVVFQKFHSPALGGFAVLSHWLPFLIFSVPVGALADRRDPRRLIQLGMLLFMFVSVAWATLFVTDTLQMWHAMALLVLHGLAGVLWNPPAQALIHDIVAPDQLTSAVRLTATARYLGLLMGPAVGAALLLALGPSKGLFVNALLYLPLTVWLWRAPYGNRFRQGKTDHPCRAAIRRYRDDRSKRRRQPADCVDDAARRSGLVFRRQLVSGADAGVRRTISATAIPACPTACCSPPTRRAR